MTQLETANTMLGQAVLSLMKISVAADKSADDLRAMALQAVADLLPGRTTDHSEAAR